MSKYGFAIDRGGTFTDVCVFNPNGSTEVLKVLSEDPANYQDAPTEAIRRVLEQKTGEKIPRGTPIPTDNIAWIRMGTTVATNALLERKGERIALLITEGFKDLLYIGNQSRPRIFDFDIKIPEVLYDEVVEVRERVVPFDVTCKMERQNVDLRTASNGKQIIVEQELDIISVTKSLKNIFNKGIRSIAVVLLHSFIYSEHEQAIRKIAESIGYSNISLSSDVMPMIKVVPRGFTVTADAYLTPKIQDYISGFKKGFAVPSNELKEAELGHVKVDFMQSDGGLCSVDRFCGSKAILSGPAGGVVGVALTSYDEKTAQPVIGFDMGGTSTDVCRYSGELEHVMESTTAGVTIQAPQLDIHTVAAGGGSRLFFRDGLFIVGPESAGAHPGPICYKKNGYLAVTDANVVLGRVLPEFFPPIFGPNADESLDKAASYTAFEELTDTVNSFIKNSGIEKTYSVEECALGFVSVANEEMCRPIRTLTQARGFDTSVHVLASFGGAGGQHACAIARILGIKEVRVHKYASLLSAYGIALANVVAEVQEPLQAEFNKDNYNLLVDRFAVLEERAAKELMDQGFTSDRIQFEYFLHLRYEKTDCAIMTKAAFDNTDSDSLDLFNDSFRTTYQREFGFVLEKRNIIVDDVRIRGIGRSSVVSNESVEMALDPENPPSSGSREVYFESGLLSTTFYEMKNLQGGHVMKGPALIIDKNSTIVVEPGCVGRITPEGNVVIDVRNDGAKDFGIEVDPIRLSIFSNRFMSIAEQMGRVLQRTSISTNIKERLDFSCALFGPDGGLIANAPHIPVHLGGMQYSVKFQMDHRGLGDIHDGDVFLSNHPTAGGSHLPDFTVITPVFFPGHPHPVFYLANRGHHADIGGLVPGSMPPNATHIDQEGAAFISFKVVDRGVFLEHELTEQLMAPAKVPGCSGTRNLSDNISDMKAQIAANNKGISLVCDLIREYGLDVVQAYMSHIQETAELSVRQLLKKVGNSVYEQCGSSRLESEDFMDDGTIIRLTVDIDTERGEAIFDFTGTGPEVISSCNAPKAVTMSAIIYCLRCLVGKDIPLNNGCLLPIQIILPPGSILSPSAESAVVAGNVLTSQRICDVIFKAFGAVAASQGCMNNVTFGDESMGYYETIAGGAGAGEGFDGRSAVHTHMTNTRITDPEILESRYPVILREFSIRPNSGGLGKWKGGNGVVRKLQFRRPLSLSILSERRASSPYGLEGGSNGTRGLNLLHRKGRTVNIGGKITMDIEASDLLEIRTPGGGGFGKAQE